MNESKINTSDLREGLTLVYNDGRRGHQGVKAKVLSVYSNAMVVQFEDRADTTNIKFSDPAWMDHLSISTEPEPVKLPLAGGHSCNVCGRATEQLDYPGDPSRFNAFDEDKDIDGTGHMTNGDRAERGYRALLAYIGTDRPDESHVRDLICDLLHYAHREGMDPVWQADLGIGQWRDESGND